MEFYLLDVEVVNWELMFGLSIRILLFKIIVKSELALILSLAYHFLIFLRFFMLDVKMETLQR